MIHLDAGLIGLLVGSGFIASCINAVAGGGSLVSFPALLLAGYPALVANVTNTVAQVPGYLSGAGVSRALLEDQRARIRRIAPVAIAGSVCGAFLLTRTPSGAFRAAVPWLVLASAAMLAAQPRLARRLSAGERRAKPSPLLLVSQFAAAVYGGFFGAGLGVVLLASLALFLSDSLHRLNALKQFLSLLINLVAALWFVAFANVAWAAAAPMAAGCLAGGVAGGVLARRIAPSLLRTLVVALGVAVAVRLLI